MGDDAFFLLGTIAGFRTVFKEVRRGVKKIDAENQRDNKQDAD